MTVPTQPKLYHIAHVDRLPSIVADQCLWSDREVVRRVPPGTTIGMNSIKQRRLNELHLSSHPALFVGDCVPFYFCPRSVMLYLIYQGNHPELGYRGGQAPIVHFEADLHAVVAWADAQARRVLTIHGKRVRQHRISGCAQLGRERVGVGGIRIATEADQETTAHRCR